MGIFGRVTARQRLRRATEESLTVPTFSAPLDCSPWVIGGLWPAELSAGRAETATLAEYLKVDLRRIAETANEDVRALGRAGMEYSARRAAEARVINEARALAVRRVESTMRHLRQMGQHTIQRPPNGDGHLPARQNDGPTDMDKDQMRPATLDAALDADEDPATTQVLPAVRDMPVDTGQDLDATQVIPAVRDTPPDAGQDLDATQVMPAVRDTPTPSQAAGPDVAERAPDNDELPQMTPVLADNAPDPDRSEHAEQGLARLLAFVARQEPRLSWAVGQRPDGTTVVVTDLAHGWIPPGIAVPQGVHLLEPQRRTGTAEELLGDTTDAATYLPGDSAGWAVDTASIKSSSQPFELPAVEDLDWELGVATHWREGLPNLVNKVAKAAAADVIVEQELDLLRVHLDTARYQILAQYPQVDHAALLNCMLLAATEARVSADSVSANYHFAWFDKLSAPPRRGQSEPRA